MNKLLILLLLCSYGCNDGDTSEVPSSAVAASQNGSNRTSYSNDPWN